MSKAKEKYDEGKKYCLNWGCYQQKENYIKELEKQNEEMLESLIDEVQRAYGLGFRQKSHIIIMKNIIEKITGKSIEDIINE
jgi:hypothetical protein